MPVLLEPDMKGTDSDLVLPRGGTALYDYEEYRSIQAALMQRIADSYEGVTITSTSRVLWRPMWGFWYSGDILMFIGSLVRSWGISSIRDVDVSMALADTSEVQSEPPYVEAVRWIKETTRLPWDRVAELLGVHRQSLYLWLNNGAISDGNKRHLLAVRDVLERAHRRYRTPEELSAWLDTPRGPDARTPAQLLSSGEVDRARLLAVSSPSPGVIPAQRWASQPLPERFRSGAESRQEALPPEEDDELFARYSEPGGEDDGPEAAPDL